MARKKETVRRVLLGLLFVLPAGLAEAAGESPWEELFQDAGITVWQREVPDSSMMEFRGRGIVRAPIKKLMAVLRDDSRKTEWMKNCIDARAVAHKGVNRGIFYNRTASPAFFISDRDVVIEGTSTMYPREQRIRIEFWNTTHPNAPEVPGVVRMPEIRGYWDLIEVAPGQIDATYQVQADAGGILPMWLVNWVNRKLPFHTINDLRAQVKKDGYDHVMGITDVAYDWDAWDRNQPTLAADSGPAATPAPLRAGTATRTSAAP